MLLLKKQKTKRNKTKNKTTKSCHSNRLTNFIWIHVDNCQNCLYGQIHKSLQRLLHFSDIFTVTLTVSSDWQPSSLNAVPRPITHNNVIISAFVKCLLPEDTKRCCLLLWYQVNRHSHFASPKGATDQVHTLLALRL